MQKINTSWMEKKNFSAKHPFIWRVYLNDYDNKKWQVFSSTNEIKANKCFNTLKKYNISTRQNYKDSPLYIKLIKAGANIA